MNDTNKKAAVATVIVLLIVAAFWTGFMDKTKKYTISQDFCNVEVYSQNSSIRICLSSDNNAYVKCKRNDRVNVNGDTLTVKEENEWFGFIKFSSPKIEIYLPEKEYEQLTVDTISGSTDLKDRLSFIDAEIESTSGSIDCDIEVINKAVFSSTSGSVKVEDLNNDELAVSTVSGSVKLNNVISERSMIIETTSGSIKLDKVDSENIEISTVSGSVNGKILSDKQYHVSTLSGSVNVPDSKGIEVCNIETVSGSVDISK
ncbi:MAG: DUF4097 family beta strand repeat-containing protein [Erysipelotrichaceae bacterium]